MGFLKKLVSGSGSVTTFVPLCMSDLELSILVRRQEISSNASTLRSKDSMRARQSISLLLSPGTLFFSPSSCCPVVALTQSLFSPMSSSILLSSLGVSS